jgi:hypothetical protein
LEVNALTISRVSQRGQAVGRNADQVREYFATRESRTVCIINAVLPQQLGADHSV